MQPPNVPVGLPSDLLKRRPDVLEADRNVAAATAQIGVAKAAYFPQLSLTGLVGYESSNAATMLNWQNSIASLAASAAAPIFTGGRLHANVEQAKASYQGSLAQYENECRKLVFGSEQNRVRCVRSPPTRRVRFGAAAPRSLQSLTRTSLYLPCASQL